ncbi:MAG: cellulase family glycosylhydrolase [Planctomycetia bacterium]|nr:cellulase family glycosylhydrolase [Planctomycetia bacterium]
MSNLDRRHFLKAIGAACAAPVVLGSGVEGKPLAAARSLPQPSWKKLPRWRGFNLLEKFIKWDNARNPPFSESDFRMIRELGFNFVRLPMDYRTWIKDGDWRRFDETIIDEIAQAVDFGDKYGIHVLLNFHRAPGYTVAKPQEAKLVWDDSEALEVCTLHWNHFARRFHDVPSQLLSFNLFNEPANVDLEPFMKVHRTLCAAIRAESPKRLIICDGMSWGTKPTMELVELRVAQATRGYMPMEVSHYHTTWAGDYLRDMPAPPTWPMNHKTNGMLFSPHKSGISDQMRQPILISLKGDLGETHLRLRVGTVSTHAECRVEALDSNDRVLSTLFTKDFRPGPGEGEWTKVVYKPEWNCYQNVYHKDYTATVPARARKIRIRVERGDWMSFEEFGLRSEKTTQETIVKASESWGEPTANFTYCVDSRGGATIEGVQSIDKQWHVEKYIRPWQEWEKLGGVMVGEFGAFNKTPHHVVLAWMRDLMSNWRDAGWGWALWNFRGSIGVLDSGREDVDYVDFHGHKLDRKMMDLLQEF